MLAQLKAGDCGRARGVVPLLAAAEQLPLRTASLDLVTAFNCVHHFDLGRFLTAVARVLAPGGQLFIYTRTPQQNARTVWGRYFPGFTEHEQRLHSKAAFRDAVRRTGGLTVVATQTFSHPRESTAERLQAQAEGRHYSTFSFYTPEELRASTAAFLARLPRPEVCWVDEHLLVVVGGSRNQVEPDGPGSLASQARQASQAIKDQALQISAVRAGQAPQRRPGGRAQITPLCAQSIAGDDLRHSAQIGGSVRFSYMRSGHQAVIYLVPPAPAADDREITLERAPDRLRGNERRSSSGCRSCDPRPGSDLPERGRGPAREAGRVSVRYVVEFAHDNTEEIADRGEAGRLQRRRGHRSTVRSGQVSGSSGAGDHRRMVAKVKGAARGRVDAHVRHEPGQDQLAAGCFAEPGV
jgi:hypothetical protein